MDKPLSPSRVKKFQKEILDYYRKSGRVLPWRTTDIPYNIYISEIMLQQTQVSRVEGKYLQFIGAFPDFNDLDKAKLSDVFAVWQGLGYNRRALLMKKAVRIIVEDHGGTLPHSKDELQALPGIGKATSSSIIAFAFNLPEVFIETNIRTVFIHFFFKNNKKKLVSDSDIMPFVEQCLYKKNPRIWYGALMDYGTMLKKTGLDKNAMSRHYTKQSVFEGSRRQLRGRILKLLALNGQMTSKEISDACLKEKKYVDEILDELEKEGFISGKNGIYRFE